MNLRQIDREIEKLKALRKEHISILFEVDNTCVVDTSKDNLANLISFIKSLDIDSDIFMQEIESLLYKIKGAIRWVLKKQKKLLST